MARQTRFTFDGGAGTYLGTSILAALVTVFSLGIAYPFALVLKERWRAKHTFIDGQQLVFTGTGTGLFGHWVKWFFLTIITVGIYSFWVAPRIQQWLAVNTDFATPVAPLQSWDPRQVQPAHPVPLNEISFANTAPPQTVSIDAVRALDTVPPVPPMPQVTPNV